MRKLANAITKALVAIFAIVLLLLFAPLYLPAMLCCAIKNAVTKGPATPLGFGTLIRDIKAIAGGMTIFFYILLIMLPFVLGVGWIVKWIAT